MREEAREQGAQIIAEMRERAEAEARRITESAQSQIEAERQQALISLGPRSGRWRPSWPAGSSASRSTDHARQSRMVDRFLDGPRGAGHRRVPQPGQRSNARAPAGPRTPSSATSFGAVAVGPATAEQIGDQLFAVVRLLDSEHGLRRALADSGKPSAEKSAVARRLLHGRVSEATEGLVADAAAAHWATSGDFADALEQLAIEALTMAAQYGGTLDDLEDDLFRFGRVVSAQPGLRSALIGPTSRGREDERCWRTCCRTRSAGPR